MSLCFFISLVVIRITTTTITNHLYTIVVVCSPIGWHYAALGSQGSRLVVRRMPIPDGSANYQLAGRCPHNKNLSLLLILIGDGLPRLAARGQTDPDFGLARQNIVWRDHARTLNMFHFLLCRLVTGSHDSPCMVKRIPLSDWLDKPFYL